MLAPDNSENRKELCMNSLGKEYTLMLGQENDPLVLNSILILKLLLEKLKGVTKN